MRVVTRVAEPVSRDKLNLWVIYNHPADHPAHYVARRFVLDRPTPDIHVAASLDILRQLLPPGLYRLERHRQDDPTIVEVWI